MLHWCNNEIVTTFVLSYETVFRELEQKCYRIYRACTIRKTAWEKCINVSVVKNLEEEYLNGIL